MASPAHKMVELLARQATMEIRTAPLHADSPGPRRSTAEFADHADPWALFGRLPSSG